MSRIQRAISKNRKAATSGGKDGAVPLRRSSDLSRDSLDFSRLKTVVPDEDLLASNRIIAAQADAPEHTYYKVLRTRVLQRLRASNWSVLGVTGAGPGEGKTLTALNLAYSLAKDVNHNVILIDADLRRPSIHEILGIEPEFDLSNFLDGTAKLEEILVRPNEERLAIMTNQHPHRDSSEILSSPEMAWLSQQLKGFGPKTITIIDLPPVLAGDDVIAISPLLDALLLVVGQGTCRRDALAETHELLHDSNGPHVLGVILNRAREKKLKSSYYDYYA